MARRRRKKTEEGEMDESWLLPYADLLTLLLALFIVLFSTSSVDAQKFQQLSQVFSGIFTGGTGPTEFQNPVENENHDTDYPDPSEGDIKEQNKIQDNVEGMSQEIFELEDRKELEAIQSKVNAYIQKNDMSNKFDTALTGEGLLLTIRDNVLFASGRADVREADKHTAREMAELLEMDPPRNIIISGHTDNIPIGNAAFKTNWELSVMRALNFMKLLLENDALDPRLFSVKGFGEVSPIGDNATEEGRSQNRRVEVLILPRIQSENE